MTSIRRIAAASALAAAIIVAGCGGNPSAPQGNYGTIVGIVKSTSGQPIAGAKVTVDTVLTGTSGADGKYTIPSVPVDSPTTSTTVSCHVDGYRDPPPQQVTVSASKQFEVDFTLSPQ